MIDPQNRVPLYPGRVTMTPVSGQANTYDMERADQPTQEGTPLNRDTLRKLQADIRTYPIASGQSISAGDVVDIEDGEVINNEIPIKRKTVGFSVASTSYRNADIVKINDNYSVLGTASTGNNGWAYVVNNSNLSIVGGTTYYQIDTGVQEVKLCRLDDNRFIVAYKIDNYILLVKVGTLSNATISFSDTRSSITNDMDDFEIIALSSNSFLAIYWDSKGVFCKYCTVSGTNISTNTEYTVNNSNVGYASSSIIYRDSEYKGFVTFYDKTALKTYVAYLTISASGNIAASPPIQIYSASITSLSCSYAQDGLVFLLSDGALIAVSTSSEGDIKNTVTLIPSGVMAADLKTINDSHFSIWTTAATTYASFVESDTDVLFLKPYNFYASVLQRPLIMPFTSNQVLVLTQNSVTCFSLDVSGTSFVNSFSSTSTQAIALQSGTAGESIEVIFSGTTAASFVDAGQEITSEGVYGFGAADGVLSVIPWWSKNAGVKMETGSYVGTGTYGRNNKNILTFDARPTLLFITGTTGALYVNLSEYLDGVAVGAVGVSDLNTSSISLNRPLFIIDGSTVSYYSADSARAQCNESGYTYYYTAIF